MQDAFGGILNLVLIVLFLVIVEGILGLTVAYTKTFRMKNYVISVIEEYDGYGCHNNDGDTACRKKITEKACEMGYRPPRISNCNSNDLIEGVTESVTTTNGKTCNYSKESLFCATEVYNDSSKTFSYHITTQVDINIPIVRDIMGFSFFQVNGDTRTIERRNFSTKG